VKRIEIVEEQMEGGIQLVRPVGKLDVFTFIDLKKYFEELCARLPQGLKVVVDLSGVDYIASSGWSVLLSRRQAIQRQGGDLSVYGMNDNLRRVYDSMKIDRMLPSAPSREDAARLLKVAQA
jgi:anti-sigma B factor antagonist